MISYLFSRFSNWLGKNCPYKCVHSTFHFSSLEFIPNDFTSVAHLPPFFSVLEIYLVPLTPIHQQLNRKQDEKNKLE